MTKGQIIKTLQGLYLKIILKIGKPVYFEITPYATEEEIKKEVELSKIFNVNLKTKEE